MSELKSYPEYKESGIEWLPTIPQHWQKNKISRITRLTVGWTPPTGDASSFEGDNLWANISDLGPRVISDTSKRISDEAVAVSRIPKSPKGSLLFSFKLSVGQVSFVGTDMYTNEAIATFLEASEAALPYAYYAFPIFIVENASENIYGAKILNQSLIGAAPIALPPVAEQHAIASYLDRETVEIDGFITDQEELVELLNERRAATITQAVTKGVGGTEYHSWLVTRLRYELTLNPAPPLALRNQPESEHSFLPMESVGENGELDLSRTRPVYEVLAGYSYFENGDVAFAKVTPCFENGKGAVFHDLKGNAGFGTTELTVARAGARLLPSFLYFVFQSDSFRQGGVAAMTGAGGLKRVPDNYVRNYRFTLPPLEEQKTVVAWLVTELDEIDAAIADAKEAIELSKERRAALISAAVTGKIDVREHNTAELGVA